MLNLGVWWRRQSVLMYRLSGDEEGQDRYEALGPCVSRLTWEPLCRDQTTARGCKLLSLAVVHTEDMVWLCHPLSGHSTGRSHLLELAANN